MKVISEPSFRERNKNIIKTWGITIVILKFGTKAATILVVSIDVEGDGSAG